MLFTSVAFLVLAGACAAAEPSEGETASGLFQVTAVSGKQVPQLMVLSGQMQSLTTKNTHPADGKGEGARSLEEFAPGYYPPHQRPQPQKSGGEFIIEDGNDGRGGKRWRGGRGDGPDAQGFEVQEGHVTNFQSSDRDGGICTGNTCFKEVTATVKGNKVGYGNAEFIKVCFVDGGEGAQWHIVCPSAKQVPRVQSHYCRHEYYCECEVHDYRKGPNSLTLYVDTDGSGSCYGGQDGGSVAEVKILCEEDYGYGGSP